MSQPTKSRRGRPPGPYRRELKVLIDDPIHSGIDAYRAKHCLDGQSDATRHIIKSTLKREGLLK